MRRIIVGLFMSLDGVIQGPGPSDDFDAAGWTMPYWTDEIGMQIGATMAACDALLLGRITYDGFKSSFEHQNDPMAQGLNSAHKYVVSNTLKSADWNNSELIRGNVPEEIAKLKQQPGKDISVSGSASIVHLLQKHDLVDEYSLFQYPVVIGHGTRLFPEGTAKLGLKLVEARPLPTGVILVRYGREAS